MCEGFSVARRIRYIDFRGGQTEVKYMKASVE